MAKITPLVLYYLDKKEVEARLHEVVLSYYRDEKELPVNKEGFIKLLLSIEDINKITQKYLGFTDIHVELGSREIEVRATDMSKGFQFALLCAGNDKETASKYITEVLPVMYGNLLLYYGDSVMSQQFMREIERPNLYDRIYGQPPSLMTEIEPNQ